MMEADGAQTAREKHMGLPRHYVVPEDAPAIEDILTYLKPVGDEAEEEEGGGGGGVAAEAGADEQAEGSDSSDSD